MVFGTSVGVGKDRYNPASLYQLGKIMARLMEHAGKPTEDVPLDVLWDGQFAMANLRQEKNLHFSPALYEAADQLSAELRALVNAALESITGGKPSPRPLGVPSLNGLLDVFDRHFLGDCMEFDLFSIRQVGAYSTRTLLEEGSLLLQPFEQKLAAYNEILKDVNLAAQCLAIGLWTAMGFHIARATEGLIRAYHDSEAVKVGKSPLSVSDRVTWVQVVLIMKGKKVLISGELKEAPKGTSPIGKMALLDEMEHVGKTYRNPLIHPEHSLDDADGPLLLAACIGVMIKTLQELR